MIHNFFIVSINVNARPFKYIALPCVYNYEWTIPAAIRQQFKIYLCVYEYEWNIPSTIKQKFKIPFVCLYNNAKITFKTAFDCRVCFILMNN